MSRGPGWLQQRLLEELNKSHAEMHTYELAGLVFGFGPDGDGMFPDAPRSQIVSVHRALKKLAAAGAIRCFGRGGYRGCCRWGSLASQPHQKEEPPRWKEKRDQAIRAFQADMRVRYGLQSPGGHSDQAVHRYYTEQQVAE